ncbi:hypothetical protein LTR17_011110 [Elasticomyces elasticus]|nr:hypothetical protein LTR17_011110 [Elasticomyces elasticus]
MTKRLHKEHDDDYPKGYHKRVKKCKTTEDSFAIGRGLFSLPAELRLSIYEYVLPLGETHFISENELICIPALLRVSSQIRNETCDLWYMGNKFCVTTINCDSSLCTAWTQQVRELDLTYMDVVVEVVGDPHWDNLLHWCKAAFDDMAIIPTLPTEEQRTSPDNKLCTAVAVALDLAVRCRHKSQTWAECEEMLETLRHVFGAYDKRWWI